jgi:hypothetical protein
VSRIIVKVGRRGRGGVSDIAGLKFRKYAYLCLGDSFLSGRPVAGSANENGFQGRQISDTLDQLLYSACNNT